MAKFYSPSTQGFYDPLVNSIMPSDVISMTDIQWQQLLTAQSTGQVITANGSTVSSQNIQLTLLQMWTQFQETAKQKLSKDITIERIQEAISLGLTTWTTPDVVAWMNYRRALRAIISATSGDPTQPLPTQPAYPVGT